MPAPTAEVDDLPVVLIADDDMDMRIVVGITLSQHQLRLVQAADGDEAIRAAQAYLPRLALLDLHMPHRDGIEVCRWMRANLGPELVIIILTGSSRSSDEEAGLAAGANYYLRKPFSPMELLRLVDTALATPSA
jgi:DNA-binding response OmpR family regulator